MKRRENEDLRAYAEERGVRFYQIAYTLNRSYDWIMRKIRLPLTEEETAEMKAVIDSIYEKREINGKN